MPPHRFGRGINAGSQWNFRFRVRRLRNRNLGSSAELVVSDASQPVRSWCLSWLAEDTPLGLRGSKTRMQCSNVGENAREVRKTDVSLSNKQPYTTIMTRAAAQLDFF